MSEWNETADIVVVGFGGAGAVSAITAADLGCDVILVEKQDADSDTETLHTPSTRMSGGGWLCPDDPEAARAYMFALLEQAGETLTEQKKRVISRFAGEACRNTEWMVSIGARIARSVSTPTADRTLETGVAMASTDRQLAPEFPELPGADSMWVDHVEPFDGLEKGATLYKVLYDNVMKRNIRVFWSTRAGKIVMEDGVARGLTASRDKREIRIRANKGIILTCGGFEFDETYKERYLRVYPAYFGGNPANAGDGIRLALSAGADLWHMNHCSWRAVMKFPEFPVAFMIRTRLDRGGIFVDRHGKRFCNERFRLHSFGYDLSHFDSGKAMYPRVPALWIFDQKRMGSGPIALNSGANLPPGGKGGPAFYRWSEDNVRELEKGWILSAPTVSELADRLSEDPHFSGLETDTLERTAEAFNGYCEAGRDPDFARAKPSLVPLRDPPYYAVKLWPGGPNTQGGPVRDEQSRVLDPQGVPIPRLYAAGQLGSIWGMLYQGGGNLAECIVFGRIAAAHAAGIPGW